MSWTDDHDELDLPLEVRALEGLSGVPSCAICRSPNRMYIELMLHEGVPYAVMNERLAASAPPSVPFIDNETVTDHLMHIPLTWSGRELLKRHLDALEVSPEKELRGELDHPEVEHRRALRRAAVDLQRSAIVGPRFTPMQALRFMNRALEYQRLLAGGKPTRPRKRERKRSTTRGRKRR